MIEEVDNGQNINLLNNASSNTVLIDYNYETHLDEVIKEILTYNKFDGFTKFEDISTFIKKKLTKLSFQYKVSKQLPMCYIDLSELDKKIFVNFKLYNRPT